MNTHYLRGFVAAIRSLVEQLEAEIMAEERHSLRPLESQSACPHPQEKRKSLTVMGDAPQSDLCTACGEMITEATQ